MADYTTSPVFSSPAYWIALGAGVLGVGAAAWQQSRQGSAVRLPALNAGRPLDWAVRAHGAREPIGHTYPGERLVACGACGNTYRTREGLLPNHGQTNQDELCPGSRTTPPKGSAARGGYFGGKTEAEWHEDFFDRYGRKTLERLNHLAHEAELAYRPKEDPGYAFGMGRYVSMYDRMMKKAQSDHLNEDAAKAYCSARGWGPERPSRRRSF